MPFGSKVLVGAALVWLLSPIDLVPEFIPLLGPLDDVIVIGLRWHLISGPGPTSCRNTGRAIPVAAGGLCAWRVSADPRCRRSTADERKLDESRAPPDVRDLLERGGEAEQLRFLPDASHDLGVLDIAHEVARPITDEENRRYWHFDACSV